ncbi:MAG TPA: TonB family protein [Puia sp.]|nr:TonB family protein [Puia sp.]
MTALTARCQKAEKYFDYQWHETDALHARFYSLIEKTDSGWHRRDYFIHSLTLKMDGLFEDSACKVRTGYFRSYHPTRYVESMGAYRHDKKQGQWLQYNSDGTLYDSTIYEAGNPIGIRISWYRSGYMRDSGNYNPDGSGVHIVWFDNGQPSYAGRYAAGFKKYGKWQYFYKAGGVSCTEVYDQQGRLLNKVFFDERGKPQTDTANDDREAAFPGGAKAWSKYLSKALYFPDQYKFTNGDEATVVVSATINEDGKVMDAEVVVPFYPAFDKIALDAVRRSPNWIPAMDHHRKVKGYIRQPVIFSQPDQ